MSAIAPRSRRKHVRPVPQLTDTTRRLSRRSWLLFSLQPSAELLEPLLERCGGWLASCRLSVLSRAWRDAILAWRQHCHAVTFVGGRVDGQAILVALETCPRLRSIELPEELIGRLVEPAVPAEVVDPDDDGAAAAAAPPASIAAFPLVPEDVVSAVREVIERRGAQLERLDLTACNAPLKEIAELCPQLASVRISDLAEPRVPERVETSEFFALATQGVVGLGLGGQVRRGPRVLSHALP